MYAEVQISEEMADFIRRDSRVSIQKRFGVAGASYLEITRGTGEPLNWDYAVLEAEVDPAATDTLTDLVDDLQKQVRPMIGEAHAAVTAFSAIAQDLQNPEGDLMQILSALNQITGGIARGEGTAGRVLRRDEMADRIEALLARLDQSLRLLPPILAKVDRTAEGLPEISGKAQEALSSLDAILGDVKQGSPDISLLLLQTRQTLVELEKLLQNMQTSWLFGGSKEEPEPAPGRVSPLEVRP
jgi:phospholipid/cholesterol/gamma-HCH transport system substrate-binding protein